jgi:photosystem II stability/assembly factor-like uncharacterized protein
MVGPGEAWAAKTITPAGVPAESIRAVFFSDSMHGWVAVSPNPYVLHPELSILSTTDGGATWSSGEISDPDLLSIAKVRISFVGDRSWVSVDEQSPGDSNSISRLYTSADAGKSWLALPRPRLPAS